MGKVTLEARGPFAPGDVPYTAGGVDLGVIAPGRITSVAPFAGQEKAVSAALERAVGLGLPGVGASAAKDGAEVLWFQPGQWLVLGAEIALEGAALTDQSDGWVGVTLRGDGTTDLMARLCEPDVGSLGPGTVLRTDIRHAMALVVVRDGGYDLYFMRSFVRHIAHEIKGLMDSLAAQAGIPG